MAQSQMTTSATTVKLKLEEIARKGKIWKPITFQIVYKYPRPTPNINEEIKPKPLKFIIADETSIMILLYRCNESDDMTYDLLQPGEVYTVATGGFWAYEANIQYPSIARHAHGMEVWLNDYNKLQKETFTLECLKTPLSFEFVQLSQLATRTGGNFDILAKVNWIGPESSRKDSQTRFFKCIELRDQSGIGDTQAIMCKLWNDHRELVQIPGGVLAISNALVQSEGKDFIIHATNISAVFQMTEEWDWILTNEQRIAQNSLLEMTLIEPSTFVEDVNDQQPLQTTPPQRLTPSKRIKLDAEDSGSLVSKGILQEHNDNASTSSSPSKHLIPIRSSVEECKQVLNETQQNVRFELTGILDESNFTLRRYLGCAICSKSLRVIGSSYVCFGKRCMDKGKSQTRDQPHERRSFFLLKNMALTDDSGTIESIMSYNFPIETFLGKSADEFSTDSEAVQCFRSIVENKQMTIIFRATKPAIHYSTDCWDFVLSKLSLLDVQDQTIIRVSVESDAIPWSIEEEEIVCTLASRTLINVNVTRCPTGSEVCISDEDEYLVRSNPRGIAVHISMSKDRKGYEADNKMFKDLFEQLNYHVVTLMDVQSTELPTEIQECQSEIITNRYDSLVLCISSHGLTNHTLLADKVSNIWTDIIYKFDDTNFPQFRGKPKVVFINTCQSFFEAEIPFVMPNSEPNHPDFLVFVSNSPGYKSYRCPELGTHFLRTVVLVFMRHAYNTEIRKLMNKVAKMMSRPLEGSMRPQLPEIRDFIFSKSFYFHP